MTTFVCMYSCKLYVIVILSPKCSDNDLCHHRRRQRLLSVDFDNLFRQPTRTSMLTQQVHWWHRSSMSTVLLTNCHICKRLRLSLSLSYSLVVTRSYYLYTVLSISADSTVRRIVYLITANS